MSELTYILEHALRLYHEKAVKSYRRSKTGPQKTYFVNQATSAQYLISQVPAMVQNISGNAGEQPGISATHNRVQEQNRIGDNNAA